MISNNFTIDDIHEARWQIQRETANLTAEQEIERNRKIAAEMRAKMKQLGKTHKEMPRE